MSEKGRATKQEYQRSGKERLARQRLQTSKKLAKSNAILKSAKAALKNYQSYLEKRTLNHLSANDMKALLNYIVPKYPRDENDKPTLWTQNVAKMRERLGIELNSTDDCLSHYFEES